MENQDGPIIDYSSNSTDITAVLENVPESSAVPRKLISLENAHNFECEPVS